MTDREALWRCEQHPDLTPGERFPSDGGGPYCLACSSGREATVMSCVFHANCATGEGRGATPTREDGDMDKIPAEATHVVVPVDLFRELTGREAT